MKLLVIVMISMLAIASSNQCDLLPDGDYKMKYNRSSESTNMLIKSGRFYLYHGPDSIKGGITQLKPCLFMLRYDHEGRNKHDRKRIRTYGHHCIEVQNQSGDTIFIRTTNSKQLDVTIDEGYFLKQR